MLGGLHIQHELRQSPVQAGNRALHDRKARTGELDAHFKVQAQGLLRVRATPDQHTLARAQRLRNLQGAFAVDPLHLQQWQNRRVVLVDDVMTTGATFHAAAAALRAAGVQHIAALAVARTPAPN